MTVKAPTRPSEPDYEAEQEVDFGRWITAILTRWWLPVAGLILGAIVGYVIALGGTQVYRAEATIYLGQPYGGLNSTTQLLSLQTNPTTVHQIVTAESTVDAAAAAAGTKAGALRGHITTSAVAGTSTNKALTQAPLVTISVTGRAPRKVRVAANKLANIAVLKLGTYTAAKVTKIKQQIAFDDTQLAALNRLGQSGNSANAALVVLERSQIEQDRLNAGSLLAQAQQVEAPRIVTPAAAHTVTARSRRNTMAVAAVIGLVLGLLAALLWDPIAGRFARR